MAKKDPYQLIFHTSEEEQKSPNASIITSITFGKEPEEEEVWALMDKYESHFCQCFFDKRGDDQYELLLWTCT